MLDPTHGAPGSPTTTPPVSPVSPPPHPIGHLEGHLAGRRRVTWWWVSPISPVSPISLPTRPGPHSRVATRRLPLLRGGGLPGLILAPGPPLLTPRVPFLLTPCHPPPHLPCHPPPPCHHPRAPRHPRHPRRPRRPLLQGLLQVGLCFLPGAEEKLSRHPEGAPLFLSLPLPPLRPVLSPLPLPIGPCLTAPCLPLLVTCRECLVYALRLLAQVLTAPASQAGGQGDRFLRPRHPAVPFAAQNTSAFRNSSCGCYSL